MGLIQDFDNDTATILLCNPEATGEFDLDPEFNGIKIRVFGNSSCYKQYGITKLNLSRTFIEVINTSAFQECTSLTSLILPSTLTLLADNSLAHITIQELILPDNITSFIPGSVNQAPSLLSIQINNNTQYVSENGFLFDYNFTRLMFCPRNVTSESEIPHIDSITTICDCALTTTNIIRFVGRPALRLLQAKAFHAMKKTVTLDLSNTSITSLPSLCFWGSSFINIYLPTCLQEIEKETFYGCTRLNTLTLYSNITKIEAGCIVNCNKLEKIFYFGVTNFGDVSMIAPSNLKAQVKVFVTEFYNYDMFGQILVNSKWYRQELRTCDFSQTHHIPLSAYVIMLLYSH